MTSAEAIQSVKDRICDQSDGNPGMSFVLVEGRKLAISLTHLRVSGEPR